MRMANDLDIEKFIEIVRLRPPLWDKLDPMRRNLDLTNGLWSAVAEEMGGGLTAAELKQRWHNLRHCFRREIRIAQTGKKKRKWIYYNQMLFLLTPQFMSTSSSNNDKDLMQDSVAFSLKLKAPDETFQFCLSNADSDNFEFNETENISHKNTVQGSKDDGSYEEHCQIEAVRAEIVMPDLEETENHHEYCISQTEYGQSGIQNDRGFNESFGNENNDDYHFAMSIIPHMKQVPPQKKLRMRIRISEVIAEESGYNTTPL